jgi:2-oxoglutarate dehydrogenase E2 component (dihydrolipoamide succinyltransferase)
MDVTMPQLGETVTEGTITRWFKQVGERVDADEPLFEVSTDKVDSEVPAPSAGYVTEILVPEGETVEVGTRLAVVSDAAPDGAGGAPAPAPTAEPAAAPPPPPAPAPEPPPPPPAPPPEPPPPPAAETPAPAPEAPPPAPEPPSTPAAEPAPVAATEDGEGDGARLTSPIVRRLLAERGLDPATITGTGPGGRLTRKDVLDAAAPATAPPAGAAPPPAAPAPPAPAPSPPAPPPAPAPSPPAPPPAPAAPAPPPPFAGGARDEVVPFDNIRRRTAEHMVRSKATSAHVYTSVEVDFEAVQRVRAARQDAWKASEGFSLTYLPFIARAFCDTVNDFPKVNASVGDDTLVVHHDVHLSIAVDLDFEGLVAPVIRNADGKRLRLIAREIHDLANRARSKRLTPDEVLGGTFTITNPGPFGTYMTLPIINQPQVAILSTDGITKRPVVVSGPGGDAVAIHHTGVLALAWDHRAFDGAYAAGFLRAMQHELEHRDWEAELD